MTDLTEAKPILQANVPAPQRALAARGLPGMQPVGAADWITVDDAYTAQLAEKARLIRLDRDKVLRVLPAGRAAADELLEAVLTLLADRADFQVNGETVIRADGVAVALDRGDPLATLSRLLQEDLCILQPGPDGHVMTAALLCFPASWTLAEKIGHPLIRIHRPVEEYDAALAARVQRLFDGVQLGRPIWRANLLRYGDPALFQPRSEDNRRPDRHDIGPYERSERQTLFRLPRTGAIVFSIQTVVVRAPG